jgi:dynein heavy chain
VAVGDDIERDIQDQELMANYAAAMESWTGTITDTIKRENEQRKRSSQTALAEIELWRSRSASYSNLIQQLSHRSVQIIQSRLEAYCRTENGLGNSVAEEFAKQMKLLGKLTSEAKENVKFLTTL